LRVKDHRPWTVVSPLDGDEVEVALAPVLSVEEHAAGDRAVVFFLESVSG